MPAPCVPGGRSRLCENSQVMDNTAARVLLISPSFFGYELAIAREIAKHAPVDVVDERPSNSSVAKAAFRVGGRLAQRFTTMHFRRALERSAQRRYSVVLIIKGEVTPAWFVRELRKQQPTAEFVFYAYDAIEPNTNPTELFPLMDRLYSFDPRDVARYDGMRLKHLFYTGDFADAARETRDYDVSFVGTLHSDRYAFTQSVFEGFGRTFAYFYVQARWFFFVQKYITRTAKAVGWDEVRFSKLTHAEVAKIFGASKAVVDLQRTAQTGLTMRTFEVLATGAHLITANATIRDAEFYDPRHITVVDDYSVWGFREKIASIPEPTTPPQGFEKYSLENWVLELVAPSKLGDAAHKGDE